MTEALHDEPAVISEALARIDEELTRVLHRDLVSSSEVTDLLLDVRRILSSPVVNDADREPVGA